MRASIFAPEYPWPMRYLNLILKKDKYLVHSNNFSQKNFLKFEFCNIFERKNLQPISKYSNFLLTDPTWIFYLKKLWNEQLKFRHVLRIFTLYYKMKRETMRALVKTEPTIGYEYKTNWPIRQPGECATVNYGRLRWKCSC